MVADEHDRRLLATNQELYELYWGEGRLTAEIADVLDTSKRHVRRMMTEHGIPRVKDAPMTNKDAYANAWARTTLPSEFDTDWTHRRVRDDGMSMTAVARELDASRPTIDRHLREANLHPNTESFGEKPWQNREWLWRRFRRDRRSTGEVAVSHGTSKRILRHWTKKHDIQRPDERLTQTARESIQADGNDELPDAAKALDPTIKSKDTPDELINDTFAFGTNNAMGGRQGQR